MTAGALTVVTVRVCLVGALIVLTVFAGVPPVVVFVVTLDPPLGRPRPLDPPLELEPLELPPLDLPLDPPLDPPLELEPLELPPLDPCEPPPAVPAPRRANLAAPH